MGHLYHSLVTASHIPYEAVADRWVVNEIGLYEGLGVLASNRRHDEPWWMYDSNHVQHVQQHEAVLYGIIQHYTALYSISCSCFKRLDMLQLKRLESSWVGTKWHVSVVVSPQECNLNNHRSYVILTSTWCGTSPGSLDQHIKTEPWTGQNLWVFQYSFGIPIPKELVVTDLWTLISLSMQSADYPLLT